MTPLSLSTHAITRYRERVAPTASAHEARLALTRFVMLGRVRATPRHWMREDIDPAPGTRFVYWAGRPDVCAIVRGDVVVTVVTRSLCRGVTSRSHLRLVVPTRSPDPRPVVDQRRWRWDGTLGEAA
jgi:hypothetical protein